MTEQPIYICGGARTPMGAFQGELSGVTAPKLGSVAIAAALKAARAPAEAIEDVAMGCVLPAGMGQAPARQAAFGAGIPDSVPATTVNKMCGSGMKTAMLTHDAIRAGSIGIGVAGGIESMSNAPYLLDRARGGYRMGHGRVLDHMFFDGLEDAYSQDPNKGGKLMGVFAEATATAYQFTRAAQDEFAIASLQRAQAAAAGGRFAAEIAPVLVTDRRGQTSEINSDEQPRSAKIDKIPTLKPAFAKDGTVTAANSSSISDGAAALVIAGADAAARLGLSVEAKILGHATHAQAPDWFTTAPIGAIRKLLDKLGWRAADADLYEINEAFAVVTMAAMRDLDLDHGRVNIHGGACALGHPVGASGARIIVTLINALKATGGRRGIASLCIGGGEATAIAVELAG